MIMINGGGSSSQLTTLSVHHIGATECRKKNTDVDHALVCIIIIPQFTKIRSAPYELLMAEHVIPGAADNW